MNGSGRRESAARRVACEYRRRRGRRGASSKRGGCAHTTLRVQACVVNSRGVDLRTRTPMLWRLEARRRKGGGRCAPGLRLQVRFGRGAPALVQSPVVACAYLGQLRGARRHTEASLVVGSMTHRVASRTRSGEGCGGTRVRRAWAADVVLFFWLKAATWCARLPRPRSIMNGSNECYRRRPHRRLSGMERVAAACSHSHCELGAQQMQRMAVSMA